MKIVFMGSPDFAVNSLKRLVETGYQVVGVITATDKLGGRGRKQLIETPVKKYALSQNIPVLQPKTLKGPIFQKKLAKLNADLQVVVAFRMLPEKVWGMPKMGTINLHASLLPAYRGAAPINWAIIKGEKITGITTFRIQKEIDTGDILFQEKIEIASDEDAGTLYNRMKVAGAELIVKSVRAIESGKAIFVKQNDTLSSPAPKIHAETCEIDFSKSLESIYNQIRGLSPYPGAWMIVDDKKLKIFQTEKIAEKSTLRGLVTNNRDYLRYYLPEGYINILKLQLEGKRRMSTAELLNGYDIENATLA